MRLSDEGYSALIPIDQITSEAEAFIPAFTRGTISLDSFLKESALDMHRDYLSRTSLLFHEAFDGLVGYVTLANVSIPLTVVEISHMAADKHGKDRKHKGVATVKMIKDIYGEE
ncbi:hypothetical protein Jab_2c00200 [Janthinobacterium sp. HH01]|uniref:hypothetical protein n=1 Tax=Janthinobacterium sp. HH01 TaxID=1198452 RepID=UPI0002AEA344|nr:hypothetical protein [Janthinobacterium sp. HH01]ELX07979.1 hypothetical protein Jab_2c00200 [Janthinobacterium sp. HH01]